MAERKERPGVMLYFDIFRPLLNRFDDEKAGSLLRAVMDYSELGVVYDDQDPLVGMAFELIRPKLDYDAERYEESREQRQYAVYCREKQKAGEPCMKISEWRLSRYSQNIGPISPDNENNGSYPSISVSPSIPTNTSAFISTTGKETRAGEAEGYKGEGEGDSASDLRNRWRDAKENGDMAEALNISNALFRMGYNLDHITGELSKR